MSRNGWMGEIASDVRINKLPLPGTHDSGARHYIPGHDYDQCQDKSYLEQLEMGVRFLDIRLVRVKSKSGATNFAVHHGSDYQWSYFDKDSDYSENPDCTEFVLQDCFTFLDSNPTECIVMSIKQEDPAIPAALFESLFLDLIKKSPRYPRSFWLDSYVPVVAMASGRIVFVNRLGTSGLGITWPSWDKGHVGDGVDVEDHYMDVTTDEKWGKVKDHLDKSLGSSVADPNWYLTYASCAPGNASPKSWADTMNPLLIDYLTHASVNKLQSVGTVLMDYVPQAAVDQLIVQAKAAYPPYA